MAYARYITEALVCGSRDNNTSDRSYLLFSRDAGMVWARARSVREERSKQRFALQDFSHVRATLVSGKGGWRVAGVEPIQNFYFDTVERDERGLLRNIVRLLRRIMQGETPHPDIFDDVLNSLQVAHAYDARKLELLLSLRILHALGYIAPERVYTDLLSLPHAWSGLEKLTNEGRVACESAVTHALEHSQL